MKCESHLQFFPATPRLVFEQIFQCNGLAKLIYKINDHRVYIETEGGIETLENDLKDDEIRDLGQGCGHTGSFELFLDVYLLPTSSIMAFRG